MAIRLTARHEFPVYDAAERKVDQVVHAVGLFAAAIGLGLLIVHVAPAATVRQLSAILIYAFGLLGMLSASALYNAAYPSRLKAVLLRLDQSMIFVMIAGSYTPFALIALPPAAGEPLCGVVWALAAIGIALRLALRDLALSALLALYLGMGWVILFFARPLLHAMPTGALALLVTGGLVYSAGAWVQTRAGLRFHNALWHAMVITGAAFHLAAVALVGSAAMHAALLAR